MFQGEELESLIQVHQIVLRQGRTNRRNKISLPSEIRSLTTFPIFIQTPQSFPRPSQYLPSNQRLHGPGHLLGTQAVEVHRFKWKEMDVPLKIAVALLPL